MSSNEKKLLKASDFEKALKRLDHEMSKDDYLGAFAPINVVTIGGFLAVSYFKNREATGDLDYMIEPQWIQDDEIKSPLKVAINSVAKKEKFELDWMNNSLEIWASLTAHKTIFERAYVQNIILFDGQSLKVWAAPFEWALERKLRRIAFSERGEKNVDMDDALALFKHFRTANGGPLDMEYYRTLNMNGFDLAPQPHHMKEVAVKYRDLYKEDLFSMPTALEAPAASYATSSYATGPAASSSSTFSYATARAVSYTPSSYTIDPAEPSSTAYATAPAASYSTTTLPTRGPQISGWSQWYRSKGYERNHRYRENPTEPDGFEYEYEVGTAAVSKSHRRRSGGKEKGKANDDRNAVETLE